MSVATSVRKSSSDLELAPLAENAGARWMISLVILVIFSLGLLFAADRLFNPEEFRIREIEVHGEFVHVDGRAVKEVAERSLSGNYFSVDLETLEQEINLLPWVFRSSVRRQWPEKLVVEVVEVQPVALWGDAHWLNFTGDLVERETNARVGNLPSLHGPEAAQEEVWRAFRQWSERFSSAGLVLEELRLDARGLWTLRLTLGALAQERLASEQSVDSPAEEAPTKEVPTKEVTMVVQSGEAGDRVERFIRALDHKLIVEFPAMQTVDLRYPNGFAIGWRPPSDDSQTQN